MSERQGAFLAAVKALDKAIEKAGDADLLRALEAARVPLSEEMVKQGLRMPGQGEKRSVIDPPGLARRNGAGKRVRRTAEELERLRERVLGYVQANPGVKLGQIAAGLGVETKDARRSAFDLLEVGELRS